MTTALAQQLSNLSAPQTDILDQSRKKVSILFTSAEAKKYSKDTFYQIGCSGIRELVNLNREFEKYDESLFGKKTINLQRAVESNDFNKKLDNTIEDFLLILSPYLEKQAALKALEWLFHRFYISSMNVNSLLMCIFPYYETTVFARILQVISLKKNKQWSWLSEARKHGVCLTKQVVYTQWASDQSFRNFVTQFMKKMLKIQKVKSNLRTPISFFITTQMGGVNSVDKVTENHMSALSVSLEECLESGNMDLVAGIYFMLIHLALKTKFSQAFLDNLLLRLCKKPPPELTEQFCICILAICNHQNVKRLSSEVVTMLSTNKGVLEHVSSVAREKAVSPLIAPFVEERVRQLFGNLSKLDGKAVKANVNEFSNLLTYILEMPLAPTESSNVIRSFILGLHENIQWIKMKEVNFTVEEIVQKLDASHPEGCDQAAVKFFLAAYGKNNDSNSVNPLPFDKKKLSSFLSINDPDTLADVLDSILNEEQNLLKNIGRENIHNECMKLIDRAFVKDIEKKWWKVYYRAIRIVSERTVSKLAGERERLKVGFKIFNILLLSKNFGDKLEGFLKSKLVKRVPFLSALGDVYRSINLDSWTEISENIWEMLPQAFAKIDNKESGLVLAVIEEQMSSDLNVSTQIFFMCLLQSQISTVGKSDIQRNCAKTLLKYCKNLLKNYSVKFFTGQEGFIENINYVECIKAAHDHTISLNAIFNYLSSVLNYIRVQLSTNPAAYKPYWIMKDDSKVQFSDDLKMLLNVVECIQFLKQRKFEHCSKLLIDQLFGEILDQTSQWRFLSLIWSWHPEVSTETITVELKLWSLDLAKTLLGRKGRKKYDFLDPKEPFVPSLLMALSHSDDELSTAVYEILHLIEDNDKSSESFRDMIEVLINFQTEIIGDFAHLPIAIASVDDPIKKDDLVNIVISLVGDNSVSPHVKGSLLFALSGIKDIKILSALIPFCSVLLNRVLVLEADNMLDPLSSACLYYVLLRFASSDAAFLSIEGGWELFKRCVGYSREILKISDRTFSPMDLVIDYSVLKGLNFKSEKQLELLDMLLTKAVISKTSKESSKLKKELRKIDIDASRFVALLDIFQLIPKVKSVRESRAKKTPIRRRSSISSDSESETVVNWRKLGLIVELLGVMDKVTNLWMLVGPLCSHLNQSFMIDASLIDVLQQQILSLLHHILEVSSSTLNTAFEKKVELDVVVVVRCIRTSHNPDIHRRALLILGIGAKYFPDQVLHSIMSIFTFMGNSLVRRDDVYSFQVIHMTIDSIIPVLIDSEGSNKLALLKKLAEVTQVFVDALPDIANHRRLPLFTQLATTMGVAEYLWLLMVLIADSYVMHSITNDQRSGTLPAIIQFALLLYSQFTVEEQLFATLEVLNFSSAVPEDKKTLKNYSNNIYINVVSLDKHSTKQLKHLKFVCLGLVVRLVTSEQFISTVYEVGSTNTDGLPDSKLQEVFQKLLEKGLGELKIVSGNEAKYKELGEAHFGHAMKAKLVDFIDAVNNLLPSTVFIGVITNLLKSDVALMRLRAMEILAQKLQPDVEFFEENDHGSVVKLVSSLKKVGNDKTEQTANRQTALFALQLMIRKLGARLEGEVVSVILVEQLKLLNQPNLPLTIFTQSILVASETIGILKASILPHLEKLVSKLISILAEHQNEHLLMAAVSSVQKLVNNVPQFMKSYLCDIIVNTCRLVSKEEKDNANKETTKENKLVTKIVNVHQIIAEKIEPRLVVPSLCQSYDTIMKTNELRPLSSHLKLIEIFINGVKSKEMLSFKADLITLFTKALDIRGSSGFDENKDEILKLEACIISTLCRFLLKLNEEENLRLFVNLISWASEEGKSYRLIVLFRFSDRLAGILKVLFIRAKLAEKILKPAVDVLERANNLGDVTDDDEDDDLGETENAVELLPYVLDVLSKICIHDSVQFMNEDRFKMILVPLVDQIENTIGGDEVSTVRTEKHLKPCIVNFTKAVADDTLWKEINRILITKLRSDDTKKLLTCLEIFEGLVESVGEDYLRPLLPDIMPSITEVLETQDPEVEKKTKQIFEKMEKILGDNLRAYLDN